MLRSVLSALATVVLLAAFTVGACAGCVAQMIPAGDCCSPDGNCPDSNRPTRHCLASQAPDFAPAEQAAQVQPPAHSTALEVLPASELPLDPSAVTLVPADEYSPPNLHLLYSSLLI